MFVTFGFVTATTAVIVLIVALIIFGPGKLPELGKSLGKGIKEFKKATDGDEEKKSEPKEEQKEVKKLE